MLLPVSLLSSYLYCPRKVFLQKALEMREPPRPELAVGRLKHAVLERFSDHEQAVITQISRGSSLEEIRSIIVESYETIIRSELSAQRDALYEFALDPDDVYRSSLHAIDADARFRAELIVSFMQRNDVEHEALYDQLTPRIITEQRYESQKIGIVGVIDRILLYDDEAVVFEFKSGKAPRVGMWPGHRVQLSAYLLLLESKYAVKRGSVRYLDTDEDVEMRLTPFVRHEIARLVEEVRSVLESSTLPRKVEMRSKCTRCGLRDACYSERVVTAAMIKRFGKDAVIR